MDGCYACRGRVVFSSNIYILFHRQNGLALTNTFYVNFQKAKIFHVRILALWPEMWISAVK